VSESDTNDRYARGAGVDPCRWGRRLILIKHGLGRKIATIRTSGFGPEGYLYEQNVLISKFGEKSHLFDIISVD